MIYIIINIKFAELSVTLDKTVVVETLNGTNTFTCEYHGDNNVQVRYPVWTYKGTPVPSAEAGLVEVFMI